MAKDTRDPDAVKALLEAAADIVASLPPELKPTAFQEAVRLLEDSERRSNTVPVRNRRKRDRPRRKAEISADASGPGELLKGLDRTRHSQIGQHNTALVNALLLLRAAREQFQIDSLTTLQIANALSDKFRVKVTTNAISIALSEAESYVDRQRIDRGYGYRYRLMAAGEQHLVQVTSKALSTGHARTSARAPAKKRASSRNPASARKAGNPGKAATAKQASRKANPGCQKRRPSPLVAVKELVASAFFAEPRVISDVRVYLKDSKAYSYESSELFPAFIRLVQDQILTRTRNDDGQFEYSAG